MWDMKVDVPTPPYECTIIMEGLAGLLLGRLWAGWAGAGVCALDSLPGDGLLELVGFWWCTVAPVMTSGRKKERKKERRKMLDNESNVN